jgi:predicted regulator of amino acid metabolism with ACT domain
MITITQTVKQIIDDDPYLKEIAFSQYANLSAIARKIKKGVEKEILKKVTLISIIVALKRLRGENKRDDHNEKKFFTNQPEIILRSNLYELVFPFEERLFNNLTEIANNIKNKDAFFALTKGFYEITVIVSQKEKCLFETLPNLKKKIERLSMVSIKIPAHTVNVPGIYYKILQFIAFEKISLTEIFSTYTELMLFVQGKYEEKLLKTVIKAVKKI